MVKKMSTKKGKERVLDLPHTPGQVPDQVDEVSEEEGETV
jgi:hypothetical protein